MNFRQQNSTYSACECGYHSETVERFILHIVLNMTVKDCS